MRRLLLPTTLGAASLVATLGFASQPRRVGPVAAIFPPWWDATRSFVAAASAGSVVRFGALPFVVVVQPLAVAAGTRLRRAGAWLVVDPGALGGCNRT